MFRQRFSTRIVFHVVAAAFIGATFFGAAFFGRPAPAQSPDRLPIDRLPAEGLRVGRQPVDRQPVEHRARSGDAAESSSPLHFQVNDTAERLEMIVRTSRILTLDYKVPRMLANNPDIIRVVPLSPNQIQVSALKPGVTQLNVWDEKDHVTPIDIVVYGDARELENILKMQFPDANIRVQPLASSVIVSGYVPEVEMITQIMRTAEDYYPKVISLLKVGGAQKVLLHVKVMEVSRTKLRKLGFDWAEFNQSGVYAVQSVSGLIGSFSQTASTATGTGGATVNFGVVNGNNAFFGFIEALRQNNMVKILAEPTLVTLSGRPATFRSGGEFPIIVPQSLGTVSVQYRQFGTQVDFVPIVLGKGSVRLEVRPQVTEIDRSTAVNINNINVPGLRTRMVETGVEMKSGQTLALAGLLQERVEVENKGLPVLADLPWVGAAFRRVQENINEVELLITVTPEFAEAMDPEEVPPCGPGQFTTSPNNVELYMRGYMEVPKCDDNSDPNVRQMGGANDSSPSSQEALPPGRSSTQANPRYSAGTSNRRTPAPSATPTGSGAPAASRQAQQSFGSPNFSPASTRNRLNGNPGASAQPNAPNSPYYKNSGQPAQVGGSISDDTEPTIIGPLGYDVLK